MDDVVVCLDTGVFIKYLTNEEPANLSDIADRLVQRTLTSRRLVAPAFAWAEVGSVLRRKQRQQELTEEEAEGLWESYGALDIDFIDSPSLRSRAWEIAERYRLPKLYDAAFLACTEVAMAPRTVVREFWTTDMTLVRSLGSIRPSYVRVLGIDTII